MDDRERTIHFRDNEHLVEVAPPPDEYTEEEDETPRGDGDSDYIQAQQSHSESTRSQNGGGDNPDEKVLVEKDGKFYYVNAQDVEAVESGKLDPVEAESKAGGNAYQPRPPDRPRPSTATGGSPSHRHRNDRRSQSAQGGRKSSNERQRSYDDTHDGFDSKSFQYESPYGLTPEEKKRSERNRQQREEQEKENKRKQKEQEQKEKEDNEDAFQVL